MTLAQQYEKLLDQFCRNQIDKKTIEAFERKYMITCCFDFRAAGWRCLSEIFIDGSVSGFSDIVTKNHYVTFYA